MQYMLLIYSQEGGWSRLSKAEQEQAMGAYRAYTEALTRAGALKGSGRLRPAAQAATVRVAEGRTQVLNGPYADSREQLGGYYMVEAPDLDGAIAWAARCPGANHGVIEVRPLWTE